MSRLSVLDPVVQRVDRGSSARVFCVAALGLAAAAALIAGWAPLGFSIVIVFLFAGPHNWLEARYFLARLPARWGRLRPFFVVGLGGAVSLAAVMLALPWLVDSSDWGTAAAVWHTALILWVVVLIRTRSQTNPRRDWFWTLPVAFALIGVAWLWPAYFGLALVYLHPLIALWILDRELLRSKPEWRRPYWCCLACIPVVLGVLWWRLADAADLPGDDVLTAQITQHAGADVLAAVSTHLMVATHAFLEMLHYGVWVLAIPLIGLRVVPWRLADIPMVRRTGPWRIGLGTALILGATAVLCLWACFLADYPLTRDIYFMVALVHVLAEAPFLLRAL
jgi:hypothetical protein